MLNTSASNLVTDVGGPLSSGSWRQIKKGLLLRLLATAVDMLHGGGNVVFPSRRNVNEPATRGILMRDSRPILLVEDDSIDAMTVQRAFRDLKLTNPLKRTVNGEDALTYLRDPANDKPCMILLDLNMPKMNGTEFLGVAKGDSSLREIPVIVLTTSSEERDIVASFRQSVAGYIVKPVDYSKFLDVVRTIQSYWSLSQFPSYRPQCVA